MSFRFSLLLFSIGAAIIFLVNYEAQGVDIRLLGFAFVAGGALGLVLAIGRRIARRSETAPEVTTGGDQKREERIRDRV